MSGHDDGHAGFWATAGKWVGTLLGAAAVGAGVGMVTLGGAGGEGAQAPVWLSVPFVVLLAAIAVMPLVRPKLWHSVYPYVALVLGGLVLGVSVVGLGAHGRESMVHAAHEYYSFIALVGGLFVASGGIVVELRGKATTARNVMLLACGAVLANVIGTTGASVVLVRPFMKTNAGRLRPWHVVFFIFIVSNCGGCLTPIGDPPLYLGYLAGVPFEWTTVHLWPMWLLVNGLLLAVFWVMDARVGAGSEPLRSAERGEERAGPGGLVRGWGSVGLLLLLVSATLFDPLVGRRLGVGHLPIGATIQIGLAVLAYLTARPGLREANGFSFEPVREVGVLFAGIFLTMAPALELLRAKAPELGLSGATGFYFATGGLSAVLDNAPTYLAMLQVKLGMMGFEAGPAGVRALLATEAGAAALVAVSLGAVFFGAMTYIGNGPNFMVKAIAESRGVKMPGFLGYVGWSCAVLLPVLVVNWAVFLR